jgi:enolase
VARGIADNASNAVLIKLNQFGTLSVCRPSQGNRLDSRFRGNDGADLVVGLNIGQIKPGSLSRSERIEKHNRLLEIKDDLGGAPQFAGTTVTTTFETVSEP